MKKMLDLFDIRERLIKETISYQEASQFMLREDNQQLIHQLLKEFDNGVVALDDTVIQSVVYLLEIAYYIFNFSDHETGMTDTEYDKLYDLLEANGKESFVTLPLIESDKKVEFHSYPVLRGTLSKVHYLQMPESKVNKSRKSLDSWIESTSRLYFSKTGETINMKDLDVYVFPKWDGVSVIFEFNEDGSLNKALTRGYTKFNTAENITQHFVGLNRPSPTGKKYGLKTEVMVEESSVLAYNEIYSKDYKQSRAIASGIINSEEPDERNKYLVIMQLRYVEEGEEIEKLCPEVFNHPFLRCKLGDYDAIERFALEHRYTEGLRCDGAVIYIIDPEIQKILGRENDKNKFEVAYKFTEEYEYTTVKDIEFQVGLLGRITPVVKIKPIKLKGNTLSSASLNNMDRLNSLALAKGDKIKVLYDIIPYATMDGECEANRSGNPPIKPKEKCPSCGSRLFTKGAFLYCENPDCDCRVKGRILNFLVKMRIQDISYATVDVLYDAGFLKSIPDIYRLEKHRDEIVNMKGFGTGMFANWIYQIDSKRKVADTVLLGSLGIPGIAILNFEKILSIYTIDELLDIVREEDYDALTEVKGIGQKKAKEIVKGINQYMKEIRFLLKELDVYREGDARFTVCFTKVRDKEMEELIKSLGGKVVNNVTENTTYLVVPEKGVTSNKTTEATNKLVPIIPIDKLAEELQEKFG